MVQNRKDNNIVAFPTKNNDRFSYYLEKLQARRAAGLPLFTEADKNEPEWIHPYDPPVYPVHEICKHPLDGAVKWTRGELVYSPETVGGQPGYKSSLAPCPHCTEEQRRIHGEHVMQSQLSKESNIPAYTSESTWDTLPTDMDTMARDLIRTITAENIQKIRVGSKGINLYIYGKYQRGKTTFVALAARECIQAEIGVYFTSIRRYLRDLQAAMRSHEAQERNIEEIVLNAPVLILDDLGAEDGNATNGKKQISEWAIGKIFDLLEERLSKGLTTYITSNNDPASLLLKWQTQESEIGQAGRIYERLIRHFTSIPVL